jgi:hypothetical protein
MGLYGFLQGQLYLFYITIYILEGSDDVVYTQNCRVFGLFPSSGVLDTRKHVSETGSVSSVEGKTHTFFFNLHSGGWNQGPLHTATT